MENKDLILSIITGVFMLSIILPLAFWLRDAKNESDSIKKVKHSKPHR